MNFYNTLLIILKYLRYLIHLSCIYNTERKSIFIGVDKFRRNPMRQVIIYDKQNDHFEKYDDVKECFVDENKLYMLYVSRRDVAVRSCSLSD